MLEAAGPDLTRVIERAGWGLRSRSLSTCRPSATARSAEAAILPASECDRVLRRRSVIDVRQTAVCRQTAELIKPCRR